MRYCWRTQKMSDKLQFVVVFGSVRVVEASDKLKFVGHFNRPFALLPSLPAVSSLIHTAMLSSGSPSPPVARVSSKPSIRQ